MTPRERYKTFGDNPSPKKEQELREVVISLRIGNCPRDVRERCRL